MTFSYPEVGGTAGTLPSGYHHLRVSRVVGSGQELFAAAAERLLTWQAHRGAGLRVEGAPRAVQGARMRSGLTLGPVTLWAPCEVVYVVDEPRRKGFAYGTLTGHPESGEEAFLLTLQEDDQVRFDVTAFSKPARWYSWLGGPVTRVVQRRVTEGYVRAVVPPRR